MTNFLTVTEFDTYLIKNTVKYLFLFAFYLFLKMISAIIYMKSYSDKPIKIY